MADWFVHFPWLNMTATTTSFDVAHAFTLKPRMENGNEMSADHKQSALVSKQQLAFATARVTANDHAKSAIIGQSRMVLMQVKHCLLTVKNGAYINVWLCSMFN